MSFSAIAWAFEQKAVDDPLALLVLLTIADFASSETGQAWPSLQGISQQSRCSKATVARKLQELERLGLVQRKQRQVGTAQITTLYTICAPLSHTETPPVSRGDRAAPTESSPVSHRDTNLSKNLSAEEADAVAGAHTRGRFSLDWKPEESDREFLRSRGLTDEQIASNLSEFLLSVEENPEPIRKPRAAFRAFCLSPRAAHLRQQPARSSFTVHNGAQPHATPRRSLADELERIKQTNPLLAAFR